MTEAQWLACEDPNEMYDFLRERHGVSRRKAGKRRIRLFGCASCRLFGAALSDPRSVAAVEYMERFAEGEADAAEMAAVEERARLALLEAVRRPIPPRLRRESPGLWKDPEREAAEAAFNVVGAGAGGGHAHVAMRSSVGDADTAARREWLGQRRALARLFREIFGNPFRVVECNKKWRTDIVVLLARQMFESRDFSVMPILADALEDAGCAEEQILDHCRGPGPHVRGCWVVDLLLGKA
jgi:hypothetical protein